MSSKKAGKSSNLLGKINEIAPKSKKIKKRILKK